MTEWPTDGPLIIRILIFLGGSGVLGWMFRRHGRLGRWFSRRIHLERESLLDKSHINSLEWEIGELKQELEAVHRRVEESRKRAERIDLLLGSEGLSGDPNQNPPPTPSPKPGESSRKPTTT